MDAEELKFNVEWFDELGGVARRYLLTYFKFDKGSQEVSIFDYSKKRVFLKKTKYPDLHLEDCVVGSTITVFGRQFKVVSYADEATKSVFESEKGQVVAMVPPNSNYWSLAISQAQDNGFRVTRMKTFMNYDGVHLAIEFVGKVGNAPDSELHEIVYPGFGQSGLASVEVIRRSSETDRVFDNAQPTATFDHCSCLVVLPHAVKAGNTADVVRQLVEANFEISSIGTYTLSRVEADEFYEVYKGVIPQSDFSAKTLELSSGPCIAMEVRAENAVPELRALAGPADVETAQKLRPNTIRARYGLDKTRNAVHVTDLEDDAVLETQFFFEILPYAGGKK